MMRLPPITHDAESLAGALFDAIRAHHCRMLKAAVAQRFTYNGSECHPMR
ncbi:hypothetical protein ABFW11_35065 [Mycolicibacterium porcinum]